MILSQVYSKLRERGRVKSYTAFGRQYLHCTQATVSNLMARAYDPSPQMLLTLYVKLMLDQQHDLASTVMAECVNQVTTKPPLTKPRRKAETA